MLKRFFAMIVILFASLAITGCIEHEPENATITEPTDSYHAKDISQHSEIPHDIELYEHQELGELCAFPVPELMFYSIEEFLYAYAEVSDGRASDDLTRRARNTDLSSLDTIHLLTNLPEAFQLALIDVHETRVTIVYVVDIDEDAGIGSRNIFMRPHFQLQVYRWTYEDLESWRINSPLDGIMQQTGLTEEDLIDGKYLFYERTNDLHWAQGSNLFMLRMPSVSHGNSDISGFTAEDLGLAPEINVNDVIEFSETVAVNLYDENNISSWRAGDFAMIEEMLQSENVTIAEPADSYPAEDISQHSEISHDETEIYEPREQEELYISPVSEELLQSESVTTAEFE